MTLWTAEKPGRSITTDVPLRTNETAPALAGAVFFALPAAPAVSGISLFVFTRKRAWQQPGPLGCLQIAFRTGAARPLGEAAPVFLWLAGSVHRFSVGCDICLMCAQVVRVPVPLSTLLFLPALARRSRSQGRGGWGGGPGHGNIQLIRTARGIMATSTAGESTAGEPRAEVPGNNEPKQPGFVPWCKNTGPSYSPPWASCPLQPSTSPSRHSPSTPVPTATAPSSSSAAWQSGQRRLPPYGWRSENGSGEQP